MSVSCCTSCSYHYYMSAGNRTQGSPDHECTHRPLQGSRPSATVPRTVHPLPLNPTARYTPTLCFTRMAPLWISKKSVNVSRVNHRGTSTHIMGKLHTDPPTSPCIVPRSPRLHLHRVCISDSDGPYSTPHVSGTDISTVRSIIPQRSRPTFSTIPASHSTKNSSWIWSRRSTDPFIPRA